MRRFPSFDRLSDETDRSILIGLGWVSPVFDAFDVNRRKRAQ
jgi:hypothetical protein